VFFQARRKISIALGQPWGKPRTVLGVVRGHNPAVLRSKPITSIALIVVISLLLVVALALPVAVTVSVTLCDRRSDS